MRLFPATTVKKFGDCEQSEFISIRVRSSTYSGVCIKEDDRSRFLVLSTSEDRLKYALIQQDEETEVFSFGDNWILSPFGANLSPHNVASHPGAFVQNSNGMYLIGREFNDFHDPILCRIDGPGVSTDLSLANSGFAFGNWRIHYFDETTSNMQKLAALEPQES